MILEILFFLLFLAVFIGFLVYIPWRLGGLFGIPKKLYVIIPFIAATILSIVLMMMLNFTSNLLVFILFRVFSVWMGVVFYLVCCLMFFELVNVLVILLKNKRMPARFRAPVRAHIPKRKAAVIIVVATLLISAYGIVNAYQIDVVRVTVEVENLNGTVDIAVIPDIHIGSGGGSWTLERIVRKTNSLEPDIVLIPGDLADSDAFLTDENFAPLKDLIAPAYFVTGNHDTYADEDKLKGILNRSGVRVMENEVVRTHGIQLAGIKFLEADDYTGGEGIEVDENLTMETVLPALNLSDDSPVVMMHHSPVAFGPAADAGVDLYIAGHTHGGAQMFPMTRVVGPLSYDVYTGLGRHKDMEVYVSEGANIWYIPMRVGTDNEITLIRLTGA